MKSMFRLMCTRRVPRHAGSLRRLELQSHGMSMPIKLLRTSNGVWQ